MWPKAAPSTGSGRQLDLDGPLSERRARALLFPWTVAFHLGRRRQGRLEVLLQELGPEKHVGLEPPIVLPLGPRPNGELGPGLSHGRELEDRGGVLQDPRVFPKTLAHAVHDSCGVHGRGEAHGYIGAAAVVMGVVHHHVPEHLAVGDDDLKVVECREFGDEEVERLDTANAAAGFDDVANAIGAKQQDHDAGGDVGERLAAPSRSPATPPRARR